MKEGNTFTLRNGERRTIIRQVLDQEGPQFTVIDDFFNVKLNWKDSIHEVLEAYEGRIAETNFTSSQKPTG